MCFTVWGLSPDRIGIWKCWFLRIRENWATCRKTSQSKDENQQQTQPTCDLNALESNPGCIGGSSSSVITNHERQAELESAFCTLEIHFFV